MTFEVRNLILSGLEIRSGGDGRTVHGLAVPWDEPTIVEGRGFTEVFRRGAFDEALSAPHRVKVYRDHGHMYGRDPIGVTTELRNDARGLAWAARIAKTREGDEALELVRDGVYDSLSVGFNAAEDGSRWQGRSFVERLRARLYEVSLTGVPVYAGANIEGTRAQLSREIVPAVADPAGWGLSEPAGPVKVTIEADGAQLRGVLSAISGTGGGTVPPDLTGAAGGAQGDPVEGSAPPVGQGEPSMAQEGTTEHRSEPMTREQAQRRLRLRTLERAPQ